MKTFLAFNIWMTDLKLSRIRDYWSTDPFLHTSEFHKTLSRDRFMEILDNLHVTHPLELENPDDKLWKVRPMMILLGESFRRSWKPGNEFTVDEDVCAFKGRSILKQYLPAKSRRWGFRIWKLCDNSNYCFGFDVYQGKEDARQCLDDPTIGEKVVYNLIAPIRANPKPLHLFMDNFFTSLRMLETLKKDGIYVTGTIRKNRVGMPKNQIEAQKRMAKGASVTFRHHELDIVVTAWMDTKQVLVASTAFGTGIDHVLRWDGIEKSPQECPVSVKRYMERMGFVDHHNQQVAAIALERKCYKWWHSLFFYFVNMVIVNGWIMHRKFSKKIDPSIREFTRDLYHNLLKDSIQRKEPKCPKAVHVAHKAASKSACVVCHNRCVLVCAACDVHLHKKCFKAYHDRPK